ncbi:MAG: hypothetical protein AAF899_17600 [Pseudomonadota bacterium]
MRDRAHRTGAAAIADGVQALAEGRVTDWRLGLKALDPVPAALQAPLDASLAALVAVTAADPDHPTARAAAEHAPRPGFTTLLAMIAVAGRPVAPALDRLDALAPRALDRALTTWTLAVPARADDELRQVDALLADLFIAPEPAAMIGAWLARHDPALRLAAAAAEEDDALWRDDLERAAALWSGQRAGDPPQPGRESAAVLPWRWRRRRRPRRRSGARRLPLS